jgi:hypothetical protein
MGIALAHLYVQHGEKFHFLTETDGVELSGYRYSGTILLE